MKPKIVGIYRNSLVIEGRAIYQVFYELDGSVKDYPIIADDELDAWRKFEVIVKDKYAT